MNSYPTQDFPPPNFVSFLAERSGLSEEAAEHRLASWLDEYYASTSERAATSRSVPARSPSNRPADDARLSA